MTVPQHAMHETHTESVQKLFVQYQPAIRSYVLGMIPDFSMADDVVQETFLVVTRKAADFTLGSSFQAWVKTIARYKALEAIRAKGNRFESLSDEVLNAIGAEEWDLNPHTDERLALLSACIEELAPQARCSIEHRYRNDHRPPEIASLMGCTVQSVNVTLSRARMFLRTCVSRKLVEGIR
jgi:RNA polymerase sigma-70 factor (ECF subfamily)